MTKELLPISSARTAGQRLGLRSCKAVETSHELLQWIDRDQSQWHIEDMEAQR